MPPIVLPEDGNSGGMPLSFAGDFEYKYPSNLNLKPGTSLHDSIINRLIRMATRSHEAMKARHSVWNKIDETLTAYIPLTDYEKKLKQSDSTKPVSIVVPYSYAVLETLLAYMTKAFLSDNVFQYEGVGPEDTIPAKLLELVVAQQIRRFNGELAIHTGFRDGLCYGFHPSTVVWTEKWGRKVKIEETKRFTTMGQPLSSERNKVTEGALLFEGNRIINIDPYKYLPDPNVAIHNVQDGEFCGWLDESHLNNLLSDEQLGDLFNIKYLKAQGLNRRTSRFSSEFSRRDKDKVRESATGQESYYNQYVTKINIYVTLIPKDWGLPGSDENQRGEYPEKWLFTVADDTILIRAQPLGLNHDMYPVAINAPDYDGYSIAPISRIEMNFGLQDVLNWTFNSHLTNVRKAINDMFIVDPSLINVQDLQTPEPGKLIRLRRAAWGRGVQNAVEQLKVTDVTSRNIGDAGFIMDLMQKVSAASDSTMGIMKGGERRSAAEFTGTFSSAISRLEHVARITSLQYLQSLAYFHASHTQQLMSEPIFAKAIGDWPDSLLKEFGSTGRTISPFDVIADFDVVFKDGTSPDAGAVTLPFWGQMFTALAGQPELNQFFDLPRIFSHIARLAGAKNVNDFIRKQPVAMNVMPNEAAAAQAQAGNLVPIGAM